MHVSYHAWVVLCAQTGLASSPDSIDTLISLIHSNLAYIWACARKHIACMHASLHAWVVLCVQTGLACSPDSIDSLIFLIRPNLAEIWACAHKHIACMQKNLRAQVKKCSDRSSMFFWFYIYFDLSDLIQFGWNMGLSMTKNSVHAAYSAWIDKTDHKNGANRKGKRPNYNIILKQIFFKDFLESSSPVVYPGLLDEGAANAEDFRMDAISIIHPEW